MRKISLAVLALAMLAARDSRAQLSSTGLWAAHAANEAARVELFADDGPLTVFHYWFTTKGSARSDR